MPKVDLDFQRYVERRKGARDAQAREGAAYAYAGDLKLLRTLDRLSPVKLALESAVRLWNASSRKELLEGAVKVSARERPAIHALAARCAETLHIAVPAVYIATGLETFRAHTFGTNEEPYVVLDAALVESLGEPELADVLGRECGHVQNNHVAYGTALYYLLHRANRFVRWIVTPALLALGGWSKRADVTGDRAGLLCTRNLDVSQATLRKLLGPSNDPRAQKRIDALAVFAESAYYRAIVGQEGGLSAAECDTKVAELLAA
ncbi:MAG TPA: M48 family metallopeptidase [Polyangia bacterium]|nr:M48 family metallopeptidase [Polyangia bacterium]